MSVIENSACCEEVAANAGSGNAEKTRTNVTIPKSAPFAEPFNVEETIFKHGFRRSGYLSVLRLRVLHLTIGRADW
jgi:hypothetical protein